MQAMRDVRAIRVEIAGDVLESVFDECDRYDSHETGGRTVGHFAMECGTLVVQVSGVIEPGPKARRSRNSLFQDGDYQTEVFRRLEEQDPTIEHLGNWHTHHVNGYPRLSDGDVTTYRRIVNHRLHNLDFFYALLVTRRLEGRTGLDRYEVRHYVLFRRDDGVYEVESGHVRIVDEQSILPEDRTAEKNRPASEGAGRDGTPGTVAVRAQDQTVLGVMFPSLRPRLSARLGTFLWKGSLPLVDGSDVQVKVVEVRDDNGLFYYSMVSPASEDVAELCETPFASASEAVRALELRMNGVIFKSAGKSKGWKLWRF